MSGAEPSHRVELEARLRRAADARGFLPFDRFMEIALYAPQGGYYTEPENRIGPSGDFYTAPRVTPLFGRTLGRHLFRLYDALGRPERFRIAEVGAGDGTLAEQLLIGFCDAAPPGTAGEYVIVERSPRQSTQSLERIDAFARAHGWEARIAGSIASDGPFVGVVVANEYLDAQPTRRFRVDQGRWRELGVREADSRWIEATGEILRPVPGDPLPTEAPEGTVSEVAPAAEGFVREVADHLVQGRAIVIDYGMEGPELLQAHPSGTIAAVRGHRGSADPLADPGTVDLSAFVNWTRFRHAIERAGLVIIEDRSQVEALVAWGLPELLDATVRRATTSEEEVKHRLAVKNLLFGFERFRVVEFGPRTASGLT